MSGHMQLPFGAMAAVFAVIYLASYFFFGFIWWLLVRWAGAGRRRCSCWGAGPAGPPYTRVHT